MSAVTINYNGNTIATIDVSDTKTLLTQNKYCENNIEVIYQRPNGAAIVRWTEEEGD